MATSTLSLGTLRPNHSALGFACFAHFVNDAYSSFIYPLLPLMTMNLHLSAAQAFWLIPIYALFSNFLQPVYGMISDRWLRRGFALFGPLVSAVFLSAIGLSNSYLALVMVLILGGIGVGMFHPQAAAIAAVASGSKRRIGMAIFSAAGTIGVALGPFMVTRVIEYKGLPSTMWLAVGGVMAVGFLFFFLPEVEKPSAATIQANKDAGGLIKALQLASGPLTLLYVITVVRAGMQMLVNSYYPFVLKEQGASLGEIGNALTIFLFAGGLGGLSGGFVGERFGGRAVTIWSGVITGPLLAVAFMFDGGTGLALLAAGGFMLGSTIPVNVAMAQELVPQQTATVSALMMGFAWGMGSLAPRIFEPLASHLSGGFRTVMIGGAVVTFLSTALAIFLPRDGYAFHEKREPEPAMAAGD